MLRAAAVAIATAQVAAVRLSDADLEHVEDDPGTETGPEDFRAVDDEIDWGFMEKGKGFHYNPSKGGPWSWMKKTFFSGRRKFSGVINENTGDFEGLKDEIAKEHTCATKGRRDETYYASSMCYWIPDIADPNLDDSFGLQWEGGPSNGMDMCPGVAQGEGGRCVKCSVCHNNGRAALKKVTATPFAETIPLDLNQCMTETEVEVEITKTFRDAPANAQLVSEYDTCKTKQEELDTATAALAANQEQQTTLNADVQAMENQWHSNVALKETLRTRTTDLDQQLSFARGSAKSIGKCFECCMGTSAWYEQLDNGGYSHRQIVGLMEADLRSMTNDPFGHKSQCIVAMNAMGQMLNEQESAGRQMQEIDTRNVQIKESVDRQRLELQNLQTIEGDLQRTKTEKEDEWGRSRTDCESFYTEYTVGLRKAMEKQAPEFYAQSCEKVCMDFAANQGCGVVEGNTVPQGGKDVTGTGQVRPKCNPPSLSWIMAPYSYIPEEEMTDEARLQLETEQCRRIFSEQKPSRAQKIRKTGSLWKRERLWRRWRQRYFVLEGGDSARSGVLRYWRDVSQDERFNQGIILWDAKSIKRKSGGRYGWRDGTECFKLYHFYRDYRLCAEGRNGTTEVNEWVELIEKEIRFPKQRNEHN